MNKTLMFGALGGAALMYYLDPEHGSMRRERLRDQLQRLNELLTERIDGLRELSAAEVREIIAKSENSASNEDDEDDTKPRRAKARTEAGG